MKRFTNHSTSCIKGCRTSARLASIQAKQTLFQSAFNKPNPQVVHGVKKLIPFLNLWVTGPSVQRYQSTQAQSNMASATSIYDFKPLDSKFTPSHQELTSLSLIPSQQLRPIPPHLKQTANPSSHHRKRPSRPLLPIPRKSPPNSKHRLKMRFHPTIRLPRNPLQINLPHPPRSIPNPRLPLQPIRIPRTRHRRRNPILLPTQLRCEFPDNGENGC